MFLRNIETPFMNVVNANHVRSAIKAASRPAAQPRAAQPSLSNASGFCAAADGCSRLLDRLTLRPSHRCQRRRYQMRPAPNRPPPTSASTNALRGAGTP